MRKITETISVIMLLLIMLTSCQSAVNSEAVETVTEPVQTEETVQPAVTEAEETEDKEEVPVSVTYRYMGYNLTIDAYDGYALISYPPTASSDDVAAFLGMEAEKYQIEGVTYAFISEGELRLNYPLGVTAEERKALADTLAIDLIIYVTPKAESAPESTVTVYSYDGNELRASIGEGRTVIHPPGSFQSGLHFFNGCAIPLRNSLIKLLSEVCRDRLADVPPVPVSVLLGRHVNIQPFLTGADLQAFHHKAIVDGNGRKAYQVFFGGDRAHPDIQLQRHGIVFLRCGIGSSSIRIAHGKSSLNLNDISTINVR